jgi:hypothetical protein
MNPNDVFSCCAGILAGGILVAAPAHAEVTFDFTANTGTVGAAEMRQSFGWDAATLRARSTGVEFAEDILVQDVYSVVCGPAGTPPVRTVHARQFAKEFLTMSVDRDKAGEVRGFRITGAEAGISGTTVPPTPGLPCPAPGSGLVTSATVVSTTTTLTLLATSGENTRDLAQSRTGPAVPD